MVPFLNSVYNDFFLTWIYEMFSMHVCLKNAVPVSQLIFSDTCFTKFYEATAAWIGDISSEVPPKRHVQVPGAIHGAETVDSSVQYEHAHNK